MSQKSNAYTDQYMDHLRASFALGSYMGTMQANRFMAVDTNNEIQQSQNATTMESSDSPEPYFPNVISAADTEEELVVAESREEVMQGIEDILAVSEGEIFEAGVESEFAKALTGAVKQYGYSAVRVIANHILGGIVGPTVASETLCILGDLDDAVTHDDRLSLLIRGLVNDSSRIREGAILGLSRLGDIRSITPLKAAYGDEPYGFLRQYISQVLQVLEGRACEEI